MNSGMLTVDEVKNFLGGVVVKNPDAVRYLQAFLAYRVREILDRPDSKSLREALRKYPQVVADVAREDKEYSQKLLEALRGAGVLRRQRKVKKSGGSISFQEADDALKQFLGGDDMGELADRARRLVEALKTYKTGIETYEVGVKAREDALAPREEALGKREADLTEAEKVLRAYLEEQKPK